MCQLTAERPAVEQQHHQHRQAAQAVNEFQPRPEANARRGRPPSLPNSGGTGKGILSVTSLPNLPELTPPELGARAGG